MMAAPVGKLKEEYSSLNKLKPKKSDFIGNDAAYNTAFNDWKAKMDEFTVKNNKAWEAIKFKNGKEKKYKQGLENAAAQAQTAKEFPGVDNFTEQQNSILDALGPEALKQLGINLPGDTNNVAGESSTPKTPYGKGNWQEALASGLQNSPSTEGGAIGDLLQAGAGAVGTYFGGPIGGAIGSGLWGGLRKLWNESGTKPQQAPEMTYADALAAVGGPAQQRAYDFNSVRNNEVDKFNTQTVPTILNRLSASGRHGALGRGYMARSLGMAGRQLHQDLGSLEQQYAAQLFAQNQQAQTERQQQAQQYLSGQQANRLGQQTLGVQQNLGSRGLDIKQLLGEGQLGLGQQKIGLGQQQLNSTNRAQQQLFGQSLLGAHLTPRQQHYTRGPEPLSFGQQALLQAVPGLVKGGAALFGAAF